jgi:hypothetical protein
MTITMQDSFLGKPIVQGNLRERMAYILRKYPAARNDYNLACFYYWLEFDGLDAVLGDKVDAFRSWLVKQATSPETIRRRTQEVQNWKPELDADPDVEEYRQSQSRRGPVL